MDRLGNLEALERDELLYLANLAEHSERYDDMATYTSALVMKESANLSYAEQSLLPAAYKGIIQPLMHAWQVIDSEAKSVHIPSLKHCIEAYRGDIQQQILNLCKEILSLIDSRLLGQAENPDIRMRYRKMRADYTSIMSYYTEGELKEELSQRALSMYQDIYNEAENYTRATDPLRVAVGLNFSVHCELVLQDVSKACRIAKKTFDDAIQDLDSIDEVSYKVTTQIMQTIRDNLINWTDSETSGQTRLPTSWSLCKAGRIVGR